MARRSKIKKQGQAAVCLLLLVGFMVLQRPVYAEPLKVVQLASRYAPPYSWYDQNEKRYRGFNFFFQETLFDELGLNMDVYQLDYNDRFDRQAVVDRLKTGELDVLVGSDRADEFEAHVIWVNEPLVELQIALFVKKGNAFEFIAWPSLQDKVGVIVSQQGRKNLYTKLSPLNFSQQGLKIETALNHQEAIDWLLRGKVDYWATDRFIGHGLITVLGIADQLESIDRHMVSIPLYIGFSKRSLHLDKISKIEQGIRKMRDSGQLGHMRASFMRDFIRSQMPNFMNEVDAKEKREQN